MQLCEIFAMQKELDRHIEKQHALENEDLFERKILALLVELGELANETRCFKFWSLKPPSEQATILEEFVDGVHFMASLGIECSFDTIDEVKSVTDDKATINEQFLKVYEAVHAFRIAKTKETYISMLQAYLLLANLLGFKDEDIKRAYISKNEVNYKRQQTGY